MCGIPGIFRKDINRFQDSTFGTPIVELREKQSKSSVEGLKWMQF
jgi:hypothetical protein